MVKTKEEMLAISIHALVKRATYMERFFDGDKGISIHALVKRATAVADETNTESGISIHALVKRATRFRGICRIPQRYFNPRPREEGDYISTANRACR